MIIDTHLHENKYSEDSFLSLDEAISTAKQIGLDGICVTDHESNGLRKDIGPFFERDGILVIVGAEILTYEGDILVFGVENLPEEKLHAKELLQIVKNVGGVAICAHPYRNNNRGLGDNIRDLHTLLDGVETFNGSTSPHANLSAYSIAMEFKLGCFGAGDSHIAEKVGTYATEFKNPIKNEEDFINAVKSKNYCPVIRKNNSFERINIYNTLK
ncbi:PHP domain-containing protein [Hathewaya histolytica]|uniref:PHP domain-containing protein n=1 Tax=Hathewaya histolytica TaxID=1498 RepID=A0A4U9RJC2_HATHI|nr:PHP domain-containing protein [Hathewaya histolytica]VTQ91949.1 PHP domain-containing protein [Hathewaya histolytica]